MRRAAVLLVLILPAGAAQVPFQGGPVIPTELAIDVEPAPGLARPLGPFIAMNVTVRYTFMEVGASAAATEIRIAVAEAPSFLVTTLSPGTVYAPMNVPPCGCERTVAVQAFLLVSATIEAPAMRAARVVVSASAQQNGAYQPSEASGAVEVTPGALVEIQVITPTMIFRLPPGATAEAPLTVSNEGNGRVAVQFRVNETLDPGLALTLPPPLTVGSRAQGELAEGVTTLAIHASPESSGVKTFDVRAEASSLEDPSAERQGRILSFLIYIRSPGPLPQGVPGPEAMWSVMPVLLSALAVRRRR